MMFFIKWLLIVTYCLLAVVAGVFAYDYPVDSFGFWFMAVGAIVCLIEVYIVHEASRLL